MKPAARMTLPRPALPPPKTLTLPSSLGGAVYFNCVCGLCGGGV